MKIIEWLNNRTSHSALFDYLHKKEVPRHKYSFWYVLGGLALFFFITQLISGVLLLFYYSPTPENANESIHFLLKEVRHGWLIRSIHSWGANIMIAVVFLHMFSVYFLKSYRKPRELMWLSGMLLLMLTLGFGFTGYLLPWDTVAYWATQIGTEIPKSIPVLGEFMVKILRGGDDVGGETLKRMFAIHVVILPLSIGGLITLHLVLNQVHGSSVPLGEKTKEPAIPFYPNYVLRDLFAWTVGMMLLLLLAISLPFGIGDKADPLATAPPGIKPEWYFLTLYQSIKWFPSTIFGISGEIVVNILVGVTAGFWTAVPFLDMKAQREEKGNLFQFIGYILIAYLAITIIIAKLT